MSELRAKCCSRDWRNTAYSGGIEPRVSEEYRGFTPNSRLAAGWMISGASRRSGETEKDDKRTESDSEFMGDKELTDPTVLTGTGSGKRGHSHEVSHSAEFT